MSKLYILLFVSFVLANICQAQNSYSANHQKYEQTVLSKDNYYKHAKPDGVVTVEMSMHLIDITPISMQSMDFMLDFYVRQSWNDSRLAYEPSEYGDLEQIRFSDDMIGKIWRPDTFVATAKHIDQQSMGTFSYGNSFIRIYPTGRVFYSHRMTITVNCAHKLNYFPADKPMCQIAFESYGYDKTSIEYIMQKDRKHPITLSDQFSVQGFAVNPEVSYDEVTIQLSTGTYSQLRVFVHMSRRCGYYLINIYLPAALLVILSWMPFCMDQEKHKTGRLAVSLFTALAITMHHITSVGVMLPAEYSIRAIDVYLFTSTLMVFLALIRTVGSGCCPHGRSSKSYKVEQCQIVNGSSSGNRCSRIVFPAVFVLFNVCYCITVCYAS